MIINENHGKGKWEERGTIQLEVTATLRPAPERRP